MNYLPMIAGLTAALFSAGCSSEPDGAAPNSTQTHATQLLSNASARMHAGMDIKYTGDPDTDFLQAMIPHHQGAIEMAKAELEHGRDPEVIALAQKIVDAQHAEIKQMRAWLAQRSVRAQSKANGGH